MIHRKFASNRTYGLGGDVKNVFFKIFKWLKILSADFSGPRDFFVDHMELDMCVKFQINGTYGVRGLALKKLWCHHVANCDKMLCEALRHHFQLWYQVSFGA